MSEHRHLLYTLQKDNLHHYLFGTMHLPYKSIDWPETRILKAMEKASLYIGEMDLDEALKIPPELFCMPEGKKLADFFTSEKYSKINHIICKAFQLDISHYDRLYPIFLQYQIDKQICGGGGEPSVDQYLWNTAKSRGIKTSGIESRREQIIILKSLDLNFQVKTLQDIAENVGAYRRHIKKLILAYENQHVSKLKNKALRSLGKFKGLMVYDRNTRMARRIHQSKEVSFIAIGAGHLGGNRGVLALLKRKGWKVKPEDQG